MDLPVFLLQHINELSMKLDIEEILQKAEGICLQIQNCKVPSLFLVLRSLQLGLAIIWPSVVVMTCIPKRASLLPPRSVHDLRAAFCLPQEVPRSIGTILGFDKDKCSSQQTECSAASKATERPEGCSNGHLRESCSSQSSHVAFIS